MHQHPVNSNAPLKYHVASPRNTQLARLHLSLVDTIWNILKYKWTDVLLDIHAKINKYINK